MKARTKETDKKGKATTSTQKLEKTHGRVSGGGDLNSRTKDSKSNALPNKLTRLWNHSEDINT